MDHVDEVKTFAQELFEKLGFDVDLTAKEGEENTIAMSVDGDNLGAIIGHHGDTLNSLQYILSLVATQKAGEFTRVQLDAGDWRKNREEQLERMAKQAIERVEETGDAYEFPPMTPAERRLIHIYISEHSTLITQSTGEGSSRRLVVMAEDDPNAADQQADLAQSDES